MRVSRRTVVLAVTCLLCLPALFAHAQAPKAGAPTESATEFYMRYLDVFAKATKYEDLLPFLSAEVRGMINKTPVAERPQTFAMMQMMSGMHTDVKVIREQRTATGVTLIAEAVGVDKSKVEGTIEIVREGDNWKLGKESWKG